MACAEQVGQDQLLIWAVAEARRKRSGEWAQGSPDLDGTSVSLRAEAAANIAELGQQPMAFINDWHLTDQPTA